MSHKKEEIENLFVESRRTVKLDVRREKGRKIDLIGFGDFHFGAKECNFEKIVKMVEWIKKTPTARVILMGDLIDCGTKRSVGAGVFDNTVGPQEQLDIMIDLLIPIKDKIYGIHKGNHEERIRNETGIDITKILCKILDTRNLGYSAHHLIKVGDINYKIFTTHGASGATLPHTKIKKCLDLSTFIDADIYMMGHVHALQVHTQEMKRIDLRNKTVVKDKKYFILTGHYLNYEDSYADMKNMRPSKQGCVKIRLDGIKKDAHVSV